MILLCRKLKLHSKRRAADFIFYGCAFRLKLDLRQKRRQHQIKFVNYT